VHESNTSISRTAAKAKATTQYIIDVFMGLNIKFKTQIQFGLWMFKEMA